MNSPDNLLPSPIEAAAVPEVINHTAWPSQYFQMIDAADTIFHVMVSRITYDLKRLDADGYPRLADAQTALVTRDEFIDAANISSVTQESDYAPFKPKCDLLFINATAYAPSVRGKRAALTRFPAGVRVELSDATTWQKLITVTGPRTLGTAALGGFNLSEPEPTLSVPVRYELGFRGTNRWWKGWPQAVEDDQRLDIDLHDVHNPIGCGLVDSQWRKKSNTHNFPPRK